MNHSHKVCTIVLGFGEAGDLLACLKSLSAQAEIRQDIIVVQNGATGDLMGRIERDFSNIQVIRNGENVGAAAGRNLGLDYCQSFKPDFVLFVDNDAVLAPDALEKLIQASKLHPAAGFLSCLFYNKQVPEMIFSAGVRMRGAFSDEFISDVDLNQGTIEVDYAGTGALLVPFQTVHSVGGFDADLFVSDEDTEWCLRGKEIGLSTVIVPEARAYHDLPSGTFHPRHIYYVARNRLVLAQRYGFISSVHNFSALAWIGGWFVRMVTANHDLAWTCAFALCMAMWHARIGRLGKCPEVFQRPAGAFPEARIKQGLRNTVIWKGLKKIKSTFVPTVQAQTPL